MLAKQGLFSLRARKSTSKVEDLQSSGKGLGAINTRSRWVEDHDGMKKDRNEVQVRKGGKDTWKTNKK